MKITAHNGILNHRTIGKSWGEKWESLGSPWKTDLGTCELKGAGMS